MIEVVRVQATVTAFTLASLLLSSEHPRPPLTSSPSLCIFIVTTTLTTCRKPAHRKCAPSLTLTISDLHESITCMMKDCLVVPHQKFDRSSKTSPINRSDVDLDIPSSMTQHRRFRR
ncbi:hypothetical protein HanPI659440_Chr06g0232971 [Helianthus annuus]|nr:hypothetical protein HanPI659440_Chr06g0232971 [Helianthus annuus]